MASRPVSRNNVIAGAFLVASLAVAIFVSAVVSGARERLIPTREYIVRFTIAEGAAGLRAGSKVTLGGFKVGRVKDLGIISTSTEPALDVRILVRSGITLFENATVFLERPLLGSGSEINITSVGNHADGAEFQGQTDQLEPGETVTGRIAPPAFLAQAGYGPQQSEKVRIIIDQLAELSARLDGLVERIDPQVGPTLESARAAMDDIRAIAAEFRQKTPEWTGRLDAILASAEGTASQLGPIVDDVRAGVEDARRIVTSVQGAIDEGRPRLNNILASAESAADKIDAETIDTLNKTLRTADAELARAGSAVADAAAFLREQMPSLRRMMGNFRLASDQLKLVTVEVRRNPWRLLYRPETKELEAELLYDAARAYAEAVSDLRAASESLEAAAATPDPARTVADRQALESLKAQIDEAFERYQEAERVFLQRVVDQSK